MIPSATIIVGDALKELRKLPDESAQCCVTSPPYWGLRDYGVAGQLGLEDTPALYVERMVEVFREVRRVLKDDATLWLNLGDSYAGSGKGPSNSMDRPSKCMSNVAAAPNRWLSVEKGLKGKDLIGIPWRVAFALQADGWWLRSDIIWAKPNCMPESVTDRPTRSHEYLFLLAKSERYHYDADAIKEPAIYHVEGAHGSTTARKARASADTKSFPADGRNGIRPAGFKDATAFNGKNRRSDKQRGHWRIHQGFNDRWDAMERDEQCSGMRNKRDVWTIAPAQFREAHFATFPEKLVEPCVLAGCPVGGVVLDPFGGSGTTGMVALRLGRSATLIELNPAYAAMCAERCNITPGLALT